MRYGAHPASHNHACPAKYDVPPVRYGACLARYDACPARYGAQHAAAPTCPETMSSQESKPAELQLEKKSFFFS